MGLINRFSDNDPYVQTAQTISANNNQSALNVSIAENDYLRATPASLKPNALTMNLSNSVPTVTAVAANTIGSALGNIGQGIAVIGQTGGDGDEGGGECFLGNTLVTLWHREQVPFAKLYADQEYWKQSGVLSFDNNGKEVVGEIQEVFQTLAYTYWHVIFDNGTADDVIPEHRYKTPESDYISIRDLVGKKIVNEDGLYLTVDSFYMVDVFEGIPVYNMHIEPNHNYVANRHRVSNLKPERSAVAEQ